LGLRGIKHGWKTEKDQGEIAEKEGDDPIHYGKISSVAEGFSGMAFILMGMFDPTFAIAGAAIMGDAIYRACKIQSTEEESCGSIISFPWWMKNGFIKWREELREKKILHIKENKKKQQLIENAEDGRDFILPGRVLELPDLLDDDFEDLNDEDFE